MPYTLAAEQGVKCFTMPADGDKRDYQFHIACITQDDYTVTIAVVADSATVPPIGVIYNKPIAKWQPCLVAYTGVCRVMAGGDIVAGDAITCDGDAHGIATTTAGDKVVGRALSAAVSGQIFFMLLGMEMYEAS